MNVRKVSKAGALFHKAMTSVKNSAINLVGGSQEGETKYFTIGNAGFEAVVPACAAQDRWVALLSQGLSERLEELVRMYSHA